MKRRLLPPCTALVLCLLLAPAAWAAVYTSHPIETMHIGTHAGTENKKDKYYLVRGETVTTCWENTPLARKTTPATLASKASPPGPSPSLAQAPAPFTAAQKASSRYSPTAPQTPK